MKKHIAKESALCQKAKSKDNSCSSYSELENISDDKEFFSITSGPLNIVGTSLPIPAEPRPTPDCSVGICHRGAIPYKITLRLGGKESSVATYLPNGGPILALPLERHPFVTVKHDVTIVNGMVTDYSIEKPSSALAVVSVPLDIYRAIVTVTKEIIQLKIDTSKANVDLENQRLAEATAIADIKAKYEALLKSKTESAALTVGAGKGRMISMAIGEQQFKPAGAEGIHQLPVVTPPLNQQGAPQGPVEHKGSDGKAG